LAKKLANPIASLISVPFQSNFDFNLGQDNDKFKYTLNLQPVIPLSLSADWNVIARIIQDRRDRDTLGASLHRSSAPTFTPAMVSQARHTRWGPGSTSH
jgi:hypothetical protein